MVFYLNDWTRTESDPRLPVILAKPECFVGRNNLEHNEASGPRKLPEQRRRVVLDVLGEQRPRVHLEDRVKPNQDHLRVDQNYLGV